MSYYTERHGMRAPVEKTHDVTIDMYSLLFDCCARFFDNIAWQYPDECPDGNGCCGLDLVKLSTALSFEIPSLFRNQNGIIDNPKKVYYGDDSYDQYGLLDFIEFIYLNCKDISSQWWHSFHRHHDISFGNTRTCAIEFQSAINGIFIKTGLLYTLTDRGMIERVDENSVLTADIEDSISSIQDEGTRDLVREAILLYKQPRPDQHQKATEKIWDALESLKTHFPGIENKNFDQKLADKLGNGQAEIAKIFKDELSQLGNIGNNYSIRHFNDKQINITDNRHYDYFFNRCLSLIALAIQYLK